MIVIPSQLETVSKIHIQKVSLFKQLSYVKKFRYCIIYLTPKLIDLVAPINWPLNELRANYAEIPCIAGRSVIV